MAIDFSQVRALQIQNEAYRQLEYIKLKNYNYFNMGETTGGLCCDFDVKLNLATGVTYELFGFSNYNFYQTNQVGYSVNLVSVTHASVSFSFGRRASSGENYTYANLADKPAVRLNGVRKIIRTFINSENKACVKLLEPDGTLIESTVDSYRAYSTIPYARPTGLFSGYRYKDDTYKFADGIPSGTLYSYKVRATEDGPLLENWLPAQRKADGAIGIYDTVNHRFLQPFLTDSRYLTAGPVFDENPQWSPLVKVKQIKDANNVVLWTAAPELTSITLAGYNTSLNINSNFLYGGTVTANYSDGSTADVTLDTTFTGYDMSTAGTQTVTASYTEHGITKTATYQLTVVSAVWHTLWSGSHKFGVKWKDDYYGTHTKTGEGTFISSGLQPNVLTKVTFTLQDVNTNTSYFSALGATTGLTDSLTSPVEFTATVLGGNLMSGLIYYTGASGASIRYEFTITSTANGGATISIPNIYGYSAYGRESYMTITKIEQYY